MYWLYHYSIRLVPILPTLDTPHKNNTLTKYNRLFFWSHQYKCVHTNRAKLCIHKCFIKVLNSTIDTSAERANIFTHARTHAHNTLTVLADMLCLKALAIDACRGNNLTWSSASSHYITPVWLPSTSSWSHPSQLAVGMTCMPQSIVYK